MTATTPRLTPKQLADRVRPAPLGENWLWKQIWRWKDAPSGLPAQEAAEPIESVMQQIALTLDRHTALVLAARNVVTCARHGGMDGALQGLAAAAGIPTRNDTVESLRVMVSDLRQALLDIEETLAEARTHPAITAARERAQAALLASEGGA